MLYNSLFNLYRQVQSLVHFPKISKDYVTFNSFLGLENPYLSCQTEGAFQKNRSLFLQVVLTLKQAGKTQAVHFWRQESDNGGKSRRHAKLICAHKSPLKSGEVKLPPAMLSAKTRLPRVPNHSRMFHLD